MSKVKRNALVKKFQDDDDTEVAILSIRAAGTGLNMTRANVAVMCELDWSPGNILQAEDRIHRYTYTEWTFSISTNCFRSIIFVFAHIFGDS